MIIAFIDAANAVPMTRAYSLKNVMFLVAWNIVAMRSSRNAITEATPATTAVN